MMNRFFHCRSQVLEMLTFLESSFASALKEPPPVVNHLKRRKNPSGGGGVDRKKGESAMTKRAKLRGVEAKSIVANPTALSTAASQSSPASSSSSGVSANAVVDGATLVLPPLPPPPPPSTGDGILCQDTQTGQMFYIPKSVNSRSVEPRLSSPQPQTQHAQPLLQQQMQQQQMQQQRLIVRCPDCHLCFTNEEEYEKHANKG